MKLMQYEVPHWNIKGIRLTKSKHSLHLRQQRI